MSVSSKRAEALIRLCMQGVDVAISSGNVPMACVITDMDGNVLVQTHNTQNQDSDPTAHAEINALRALGKIKGSRYLEGCVVFSNAETCSMCMSARIKARIRHFYYGAPTETSMDPWITMQDVAAKSKQPLEIRGSILADECAAQIARGRAALAAQ